MKAKVFLHGVLAGRLSRDPGRFTFVYDDAYIRSGRPAISLSLPITDKPYVSEKLQAFFSNLVSEGWLRRIQSREQHIDEQDEFMLLVQNGADLPGAVTIELQDLS